MSENFFYQPEQPLTERLRFLTDLFPHKDGSEQRVALRIAPRQEFDLDIMLDESEAQSMNNVLFGARNQTFNLPVWCDPVYLTAAAPAASTTLTVSTMAFADFRSGGKALVRVEGGEFELVENITITDVNTITLDDALVGSFPVLAEVYPVRQAMIVQTPKRSRWPVNLVKFSLTFQVIENDVDLSSISTLPLLSSKPFFTDPNRIEGNLDGAIDQDIFVCDGNTGPVRAFSFWPTSRGTSNKGFKTFGAESLWRVRQFLHWAKGKQKSFYLPTFGKDLTPTETLANTSSNLYVANVGYTAYVNARQSRNKVRVVLNSGVVYTRGITASTVIDENEERLTIDSPWVADVLTTAVARIEFTELVRMDSDDILISHLNNNGEAIINLPVKSVLE